MARAWLLLLLLGACEREAELWPVPRAGDHVHYLSQVTTELIGPDGVVHHGRANNDMVLEVLAATSYQVTKYRVTFLYDAHLLDARILDAISGTYELTLGTPPSVVKLNGEMTAAEREYLDQLAPRADVGAGVRSLKSRRLKAGDHFTAEPSEASALGYRDADRLDVTVEELDSSSITLGLDVRMTDKEAKDEVTTARGHHYFSDHGDSSEMTGEFTYAGHPAGHLHSETQSATYRD